MYVKELEKFLTMKVLENTPAVLSLGKLCDENGCSYEWINSQKPHLIKNGIRIQCHCSTSSSSSSSSPTGTSRDNETRERENRIESDMSPVTVSTTVDDRSGQPVVDQANKLPKTNKKEPKIEQDNPLCSEIPEWLQEFREILVDDEIPQHGPSHASSSHEVFFRAHIPRDVRIWVSTVFILISRKTEIARSARGPKLQGPRAEDAMAEPYLVLKILVT